MGRHRTQTSKLHRHCESCHSRRCKTPIEISVSCAIMSCRLLCGAVFHLCKEEEHMLLCPNERVPCLNVEYGCPFTMCRSNLARHLTVCPASVVSCSMEWNRWPIEESETPEFYENILKENYIQEPLDLSMALRDQHHLFHSLKMKTLFPELIEKVAEEPLVAVPEGAVGGVPLWNGVEEESGSSSAEIVEGGLTQEEREELARNPNVVNLESYNIWEKMFSMELSGCKHTLKSLGQNPKASSKEIKPQANPSRLEVLQEELPTEIESQDTSTDELQYHFMDEDKFLIATSLFACDTRPEKKLVYEHLEPMKIKTVCTFKIPTSFKAKQSRIRNPSHNKKVNVSVDTSDLGVEIDDMPKWDEVQATLLCSLEKELRGHLIAESGSTDALLLDVGTQTYDFYSAPFQAETSLADITADRALKLHVQIQAESVTRRHNKSSSAFTYLCNHIFRRDEFPSHYKNIHSDIQSCVNGWFEQRCPLAYLGCTFIQRRFQPNSHRARVFYDKELSTFCLRPEVSDVLYEGIKPVTVERKRARNTDALSRLPFEVLVHVAEFLDSFTLSQLALVSCLMREVCRTLLHDRGTVSLKWEKKVYSHGGWCWRARKRVWQYSNLFSTVDSWCFDKLPPISEHLKDDKCAIHGKDGVNGVPGRDGLPGAKGEKGAPALQDELNNINLLELKGEAGIRGPPGEIGPKGFMGAQGPKGSLGPKGPRGSSGGSVGKGGAAGIPGFPGRDGREGMKGEKGQAGMLLRADETMKSGERGEAGIKGIPGKRGLQGDLGVMGPPGPSGEPGDPGSLDASISHLQSAFSVFRKTRAHPEPNSLIRFSEVITDINKDFNIAESKFVCKIPGTYYFVFHASSTEKHVCVNLVHDDKKLAVFCDHMQKGNQQVSSGGLAVYLKTNEKVWLTTGFYNGLTAEADKADSVFSGFLIHAH
ncbi:hypothetical protein QQF64_017670 [Cirrhinus molitorella]|uniref:F-box protein 40 n=1 Tax=Cirrhinus molitorella TaxID=172907 RepID=A0ABR3LJB5_9TELE